MLYTLWFIFNLHTIEEVHNTSNSEQRETEDCSKVRELVVHL